jgi:hypothetical protein
MTGTINNTEMYDTVLFRKRLNKHDSTTPLVANLEKPKEVVNMKTGELSWQGRCRNLKVFVNQKSISINGSLAKYYNGNNVEAFGRLQAKEAIENLSDILHIDMSTANITGLDFSATIKVNNPVPEYLSLFSSCSTFIRVPYGADTVYYNPPTKTTIKPTQLCIYDKVAECMDSKVPIPHEYANNNLLRYELKLRQRLAMRFGRVEVIGRTLYEPEFYALMMDKWVKTYFEINKNNVMRLDYTNNIKTPKDALEAYMAYLITTADNGCFEAFLRDLKANKAFGYSKDYTRLKTSFGKINSNSLFTDSSVLIDELDKSIRDIGKYGE